MTILHITIYVRIIKFYVYILSCISFKYTSIYFFYDKDQPEINYIENDFSNFKIYETFDECKNACLIDTNPVCKQFIYFNDDYILSNGTKLVSKNSCFLRQFVNIHNGVSVRKEAEAWSIRLKGKSYLFNIVFRIKKFFLI